MGKFPDVITPELVATLIMGACKGDKKLPPIEQVVVDFPAHFVLQARSIFIARLNKLGEVGSFDSPKSKKDRKRIVKCIKKIENRFNLKNVVVRSPSPALHRLLKGETGDAWT